MLAESPTEYARRWVQAAEAAGDDYEHALGLNMTAVAQSMTGDPSARDTARQSLRLAHRCGSPSAIAYCLFTTAMVDAPFDPAGALDLLEQSQRAAAAAANTFAAFVGSGIRNAILLQSGQYEAAAHGYLDAAQHACQYGRLDHMTPHLAMLAACLVAQGTPEPAAVIEGWIQSIIGDALPLSPGALYDAPIEWMAQLPETLGPERYTTLKTTGAAMNAAQILNYAQQQVTPPMQPA
jgi:hypothetical protein